MNPEIILRIAKGIGGLLASIAAEKAIEKVGKRIIKNMQ